MGMEDWWYFIEGRLSNNSTLELFHNQGMFNWKGSTDMSKEKRWNFYKSVSNHRWMKFYETINYGSAGSEPMKLELGKYICREWNARHSAKEQLRSFTILKLVQGTPLPGQQPYSIREEVFWTHEC